MQAHARDELFVPGRVCLFGEHSDWAGEYRRLDPGIEKGHALIAGTNQGIHALIAEHPTHLVLIATGRDGSRRAPGRIPMAPAALLEEAQRGGFWSYIAGVAYQVLARHDVRGLVLDNDRTDLPVKKGLSSSAAISVLTARAFNRVYDLKLTLEDEMELAYLGETTTGSRCGRMDQACAYGNRPVLMTFDGDRVAAEQVRTERDLHFVIVDLQAGKDTMKILADLHRSFSNAGDAIGRDLRELLGEINRRMVEQAVEALRASDAERLGRLMSEAQGLFDRYAVPACPEELTAPVLHRVLSHPALRAHIWGGKGVGSQGDGAAQFVARGAEEQRAVMAVIERDLKMPCLALTLRGDR
jgi:mevalonate kinase